MHITEIVTLDRTIKPDHTLGLVGPRPSRLPVMVSSLGGTRRAPGSARTAS